MDDLRRIEQRWLESLERAEELLPSDPNMVCDLDRRVIDAIEHCMRRLPEARAELEQYLCQARTALAENERARARFQREAEERERHFHAREYAGVRRRLAELRRPWPPAASLHVT